MAKTIRVLPLPDSVSMRSNWQVKVSGRRKSTHLKKTAAVRKARTLARDGDILITHKMNGQFQDQVTVRKGR